VFLHSLRYLVKLLLLKLGYSIFSMAFRFHILHRKLGISAQVSENKTRLFSLIWLNGFDLAMWRI